MANILVTGGAGYVGSVCCAELLRLGHSVTVVDDLSTGSKEAIPSGAVFFQLNIGNSSALQKVVETVPVDVVFHFAAKTQVAESVIDPAKYYHDNVAAGIAMLEVLRAARIKNFVFSSSAAVYGFPLRLPIGEDDPKNPINPYGESKFMFERILEWYAKAYGWSVIALRYFNAAGATPMHGESHHPETHLIPLLLEAADGEREFFTLYGSNYDTPDGTCIRDYVHVLDVSSAHICALQDMDQGDMRCYNIGSGAPYSVQQVSNAVEKITGQQLKVRRAPGRPGDPPMLWASPRKIMRELGWEPEHSSLEEIISSAWQWKQTHRARQASAAGLGTIRR